MSDDETKTIDHKNGDESAQVRSDLVSIPLSKNQQKKLKRREAWEAGREERKVKRRKKAKEKKLRLRAAKVEDRTNYARQAGDTVDASASAHSSSKSIRQIKVPMTFVIDCGFDELMIEKEINSLSSQVTRCYAQVKKAIFQPRVAVTSFGGRLKKRYDTVLHKDHKSWRDIHFTEKRFNEVESLASEWMVQIDKDNLPDHMKPSRQQPDGNAQIIYLSGDSPTVLDRLEPNHIYIIGGLVDRNRHKGVCYKRAANAGIRTARLPIEEYLEMSSRTILATNHVIEIMLKWLVVGHWGQAFLSVIPQRKGGKLKVSSTEVDDDDDDDGHDDEKKKKKQESDTSMPPMESLSNKLVEQEVANLNNEIRD